ncbi:MAG: creatininase family protein [Gemmatimonadota bacterium]|nr:MAG: creatininase family protein [Gemmatimonadota bacterium]
MAKPVPVGGGQPLLLADLTWPEVAEYLERDRRLIIPVGTCEQHGRHLPLGTDTLVAERLAHDLSAEFGVLVAPTLAYGVNVETEEAYSGTASLRRKTLHRALNDLLASWEGHGFDEFILITAHFHDPHLDAVTTVVTEHARARVVDIQSVDIRDYLDQQSGPEHAGEAETSVMLYLRPDLVRADRIQDYLLDPQQMGRYLRGRMPKPPAGCEGAIGHPSSGTAKKGEKIYRHVLARIREKIFSEPDE